MKRLLPASVLTGILAGVSAGGPAAAQTSPTTQCVASAYASGTADAITIPALPCALTTNLLILSTTGTNITTTPTLQPLGLPAQTIIRSNGNPAQAGDLVAGGKALLTPTGNQWVLLNPSNVTGGSGSINGAPAGYMAYYANTGSILSGTPLGAGVLSALTQAADTTNGFVSFGGALGTPSSGTATYITGLPITTGVSGLGLGVAIALGLSPGAIGSFVVNGGALGVPTSGIATYLTGLPLTSGVTGTLGVTNGGTGGTSFTTNRPIVGNGSGALTTGTTSGTGFILATELAAIPAGHCVDVDGNGNLADAGGTCTTGGSSGVVASGSVGQFAVYSGTTTVSGSTTGTGVVTASGVNIGTAGSFVVNGGVLGTPSSGSAANLTSIPMGNASGTLGVANGGTGATTLASGKPLLGNGTGAFTSASISGNTTTIATTNGSLTSGDCAKFDVSGNIVDASGPCGSPLSSNNTWTGTNTFNNSVSFVSNPTFPVQSANVVFAGPTSGGSVTPTWRGLVAADLPTTTIAKGGTGQTTANAGFNALSPMTTAGDMIYGGASGAGTRLAAGTAGQVLRSNGTGSAPSWSGIQCSYLETYGGAADDSTDNTTPFNNLVAAFPSKGGCIALQAGVYKFNSQASFTFSAQQAGFAVLGAGAGVSTMHFATGINGLVVNYYDQANQVLISGITFATDSTNTGSGVILQNTNSIVSGIGTTNVIENCSFTGLPTYGSTYWLAGVTIHSVSNVNFTNDAFEGVYPAQGQGVVIDGSPVNFNTNASTSSGSVLHFASTTGVKIGMYAYDASNLSAVNNIKVSGVTGTTVTLSSSVSATVNNGDNVLFTNIAAVYNFDSDIFQWIYTGMYLANGVQGVAVDKSNFLGAVGIFVPSNQFGLVQLAVANSQFAEEESSIFTGSGSNFYDVLLTNNFFTSTDTSGSWPNVYLQSDSRQTVTGNHFLNNGGSVGGSVALAIGGTVGVVTGNIFQGSYNCAYPTTGSSYINFQSNAYTGCTNNLPHNGTNNTFGGGSQ